MEPDLRTRMLGGRQAEEGVMKTMLIFSFAMLFFPVFLYFFSKSVFFEGYLGYSNKDSYFYAAFVAVGTVHIILGLFVYKSFSEEVAAHKPPKIE
ncbi:vacuolar ATPase assembly integral membrane protein vma21 [Mactra antiquata]